MRGVAAGIGLDLYVDGLSWVDCKGLCDEADEVLVNINRQSLGFARVRASARTTWM